MGNRREHAGADHQSLHDAGHQDGRPPPTIDGVIDVDEWRDAARVADFIQFQPNRGEPAELETEVFVLYDDAQLYVAFRAYDPEPLIG